jgi:hypothetical protein
LNTSFTLFGVWGPSNGVSIQGTNGYAASPTKKLPTQ